MMNSVVVQLVPGNEAGLVPGNDEGLRLIPGKLYISESTVLEANYIQLRKTHYETYSGFKHWFEHSSKNVLILPNGVPWMYIEDCSDDIKKYINNFRYIKIIYKRDILYVMITDKDRITEYC